MLRFTALAVVLTLAPSALAQDLAPTVFPNPISDQRTVTVEVADAAAATVEVVDVLGRRVSLDAPLAAGTYLVRARYADGRVTSPTSVTIATPGRVELRLAEAADLATWADAPTSAPLPTASNQSLSCAQDEVFGGFYFQENAGQLRKRPDLMPASLRVQTNGPNNGADFTTCFGEVQGTSFRYIAGGDPGNRPLRFLSPAVLGNTTLSYNVLANDGVAPFSADYGWTETNAPGVPASQFNLNTPFFPGLGLYELIVLDGTTVVQRGIYDGDDGLFVTSNGPLGRLNMLRSILISSIVDGFQVDGGTKPGDISFVFEMESEDGSDVNFHAGPGSPIVGTGTTIHITPKFAFPDPYELVINEIRTVVTGMNRFGIRALRFAVGGSTDPFLGSEAQFTRISRDFLGVQENPAFDAQAPFMMAQASSFGTPDVYGLQFGREPDALGEFGSDEIGVLHGPVSFAAARGGNGVLLDDDGEYYRAISLVRNETDTEGETITAVIENTGSGVTLNVTNANATFNSYQFVFDRDGDGTSNLVATYPVGVPQSFSPNAVTVVASGSSDFDDDYFDAGTTQDFLVGFLVELGGGDSGIVYIFPNFTSNNADVDVRAHSVETNQPYQVVGVRERDEEDPPAPLTLFGGERNVRQVKN